MADRKMPTTSAWAALWGCTSRWPVPSDIAAWRRKCRMQSNVCCGVIWTSVCPTKICGGFSRVIAMKNCASVWQESSWRPWREILRRERCRMRSKASNLVKNNVVILSEVEGPLTSETPAQAELGRGTLQDDRVVQ